MSRNKKRVLGIPIALILIFFITITLYGCGDEFYIEGKWRSVGDEGFGQAQPGAIVVFDGKNCNLLSPNDTYSLSNDNGEYKLYVTGLLGGNVTFNITLEDNDHIILNDKTELERIE